MVSIPTFHFTTFESLMLVLLASFLVPILLSRWQRVDIPIVVGEIIAGIIIGPSLLGIIDGQGEVFDFLLDFGLAYLMFIAGMEIDFTMIGNISKAAGEAKAKITRHPIILAVTTFSLTLVISYYISTNLVDPELVKNDWMLALILSTTSLGVVLPVLKERRLSDTRFGQTVLMSALFADFVTMLLISLLATYLPDGELNIEMLLVFFLFLAFAVLYRTGIVAQRSNTIRKLFDDLSHATSQIKLRASLAILVSFIVLAEILNAEMILGAFIAGVVISLLTKSPERKVERDLEAFGFSFFIPIFFILVGVSFDVQELISSKDALLLVPLLLAAAIVVKMVPMLLFRFSFTWKETFAAGSLLSARLSLIIAASLIALEQEIITPAVNSAIILVAIITVTLSPIVFSKLMPNGKSEEE
jgi:Kef-type K+ transport system membrane component KefB